QRSERTDRHTKQKVPLLRLAQCPPSVAFVGHAQQTPSLPHDVHVFTVPLEKSGPGTVPVACLHDSQCLEELRRNQGGCSVLTSSLWRLCPELF
ncbi:hypothetical protein J4Q44_G00308340, partial [Coregonus suidteri]